MQIKSSFLAICLVVGMTLIFGYFVDDDLTGLGFFAAVSIVTLTGFIDDKSREIDALRRRVELLERRQAKKV